MQIARLGLFDDFAKSEEALLVAARASNKKVLFTDGT